MKTFEAYLSEATEAQVRTMNPQASPEMVRRAAEKSQRSAAQREGNQKRRESDIKKGKRSLPGKGEIVKTKSSAIIPSNKSKGALVKTKPESSKLALKKKSSYFTKPDGVNKRSADNKIMGSLAGKKGNDLLKNEKKGRKKLWNKAKRAAKSALKGTRGQSNTSMSTTIKGLESKGTQI